MQRQEIAAGRHDARRGFMGIMARAGIGMAALVAVAAGTALGAAGARGDGCGSGGDGACSAAGTCLHTSKFQHALELVAQRAADPGAARVSLALHGAQRAMCFPEHMTAEQIAVAMERYALLPPAVVFDGGLRFFTATTVWTGDISPGESGRGQRARLTYSFVPDGSNWDGEPSQLDARLAAIFGPNNIDRGKEYIRQGLANWRRSGGLVYQEVADDGATRTQTMTRTTLRGDIRVGAIDMGGDGPLAYNYYPGSGGDMALNTFFMGPAAMGGAANNFRYLRNVIVHEHGHGLGYQHALPCDGTKIMEPFATTGIDMLTVDERRGAGRNYGDRYSGNNSAANAVNFGDLTSPTLRSVIERDLSTNGVAGALDSREDWFRFTLSSAQPVTITAQPTGGTYANGPQDAGCEGSVSTVNAAAAGNLNVELRNATGTTLLHSAISAPAGQPETITVGSLPAGTYTVRVFDSGPNLALDQRVQLYDLTVRVANAPAPPQAIAGVNKRCAANSNCFFMGNINSRAMEPGATIAPNGYAWDMDDDGVYEIVGNATPNRQFISNGAHTIRLRVTDSNGMQGTDTITVTVFGATTQITGVTPNSGHQGQTVPVTLTGRNFKNVTSASMITVGGNVQVLGTPVSNGLGTQLTGISFRIPMGTPAGPRNITISNQDGVAVGEGLFNVLATVCRADWNFDTLINSADLSAYITSWLASVQQGTLVADVNGDGVVNSTDLSAFIAIWLNGVANGC